MKKLVLFASCSLLLGAMATGCGDRDKKKSDGGVEITEFAVNEVIMTADRNYRALLQGDTVYLDQYVSLLRPKSLGDADLSVLRDSLLSYCFGDTACASPEEAIRKFVSDVSVLTGEDGEESVYKNIEPVDSLPEGIAGLGCYFNNVTASVTEAQRGDGDLSGHLIILSWAGRIRLPPSAPLPMTSRPDACLRSTICLPPPDATV